MAISYLMGYNPVWFFVDESGQIATGATMGTFESTNHATPKAVYQNPDGTGPYPNPVPLNTKGAAPIYFSDSGDPTDKYYLEVYDSDGNVLWTIDDYLPAEGGGGGGGTTINGYTNYLVNPQFRFNYGTQSGMDLGKDTPLPVAQGGWSIFKDGTGSNDTITFPLFSLSDNIPEGTPIQYFNWLNTSVSTNESFKFFQFFIPDVRSFSQNQVCIQIAGKSVTTSTVRLSVMQYFGTGGSPSTQVKTPLGSASLTSSWNTFIGSATLPSVGGKTLGTNGDDGVYAIVELVPNTAFNISLTNMQFKLGNTIVPFPVDSFNLDRDLTMGSQIPVPDNGVNGQDIGKALTVKQYGLEWNKTLPTGMMYFWPGLKTSIPSDSTYCDGSRQDRLGNFPDGAACQDLFDVIDVRWGNGYDYLWCNSNGTNIIQVMNAAPKEVTAAANGTPSPGFTYDLRVAGIDDGYGLKHVYYLQGGDYFAMWTQVNCVVTVPATVGLGTLAIYAPATSLSEGLYLISLSGAPSTFNNKYFTFQKPGTTYVVWINYNGTGTAPSVPSTTNIAVDVSTTDTLQDVILKIAATIRGAELTYITTVGASGLTSGSYFLMEASGQKIAVWYSIEGAGTAPVVTDYTAVRVDLTAADTNIDVATKTMNAVNTRYYQLPDGRGGVPMGLPDGSGIDPGVATRFSFTNPTISGDNVGTYQFDQNRDHDHSFSDGENYATENFAPGGLCDGGARDTLIGQSPPFSGQARVTPYNFGGYWVISH